jgi:serine/threonine protein kinase
MHLSGRPGRNTQEYLFYPNGANQLTAAHDYNPNESDAPNLPLAPESVLQDRYRIVRQLGRGGMGAVYEAVDQRLGITVALKETLSSEESMRKQFEREARLLAGMHHPALPRVSDHFVEGKRAFLVMQFIGGVDLAKIISQQPGPFPRDQVIAWADQLLDALIYLHSRDRQVIHRDIKPHNLKLTANGQIALLDFGLAKAQPADSSITSSQAFFGYTRHYAPLEQIQDQHTDPRSDIYALGATLYHLLTGIKPPDAMVRASATVNGNPDPLKFADKIHEAVGPQIAAILDKAMAQRPEDRYADANEFREALRRMGRTKEFAGKVSGGVGPKGTGKGDGPTISPTVHIDTITSMPARETGDLKIPLVASARHFGPAGATAVIAIVLALAGGIIYGAQRWFPGTDEVTAATDAAPPNAAASLRSTTSPARRSERPRAVDNLEVAAAKTRNVVDTNTAERTPEKRDVVVPAKSVVEKKMLVVSPAPRAELRMVVPKSQAVSNRSPEPQRAAPRKDARPIGAPNIRFPKIDFRDNAPAPSRDSRIRAFGSSYTPPKNSLNASLAVSASSSPKVSSNAPPRFYRTADGTQIVKFSDGSTQFIRRGDRSARAANAQR